MVCLGSSSRTAGRLRWRYGVEGVQEVRGPWGSGHGHRGNVPIGIRMYPVKLGCGGGYLSCAHATTEGASFVVDKRELSHLAHTCLRIAITTRRPTT